MGREWVGGWEPQTDVHFGQHHQHNLPELFSYDHGSHSVAVYRGAALKAAIAAGLVKGFPGSGAGRGGAGDADRSGRQFVAPPPPPPLLPLPPQSVDAPRRGCTRSWTT